MQGENSLSKCRPCINAVLLLFWFQIGFSHLHSVHPKGLLPVIVNCTQFFCFQQIMAGGALTGQVKHAERGPLYFFVIQALAKK